jgi:hypothetical protein
MVDKVTKDIADPDAGDRGQMTAVTYTADNGDMAVVKAVNYDAESLRCTPRDGGTAFKVFGSEARDAVDEIKRAFEKQGGLLDADSVEFSKNPISKACDVAAEKGRKL